MSTNPHSVGANQSLKAAADLMDRYHIRHLPVLEGGNIVGIITDRDIKFALSLKNLNPEETLVNDITQEEVYIANPFSRLEEVVEHMAERKLGSAVIMDNGKLVGMFTAVDALIALSDVLRERHHHGHSGGVCCGRT